jgi:hypothetical protein
MITWKDAAARAAYSGTSAALLSAAVLAFRGKRETGSAAAALNGPSQWIWGPRAADKRGASVRHTLLGYGIHHFAAFGWALLFEKHIASRVERRGAGTQLLAGVAAAAVSCAVDYGVARGRLQPGFERQLSLPSLALVYAAFGLGLAIRPLLHRRT